MRGQGRLIPAWAGKTRKVIEFTRERGAHPRVGGENYKPECNTSTIRGSSPRGRGKLNFAHVVLAVAGLIPAWAGKTQSVSIFLYRAEAHPRVGGENLKGPYPC